MAERTVIEELVTLLGFEIKDQAQADSYIKKTKAVLKTTAKLAAVATTAAAALFGMANSLAKPADEAAKFGRLVNEDTDLIQQLTFAAEQNGGSLAGMQSSLFNVNRALGEAARGAGRAKRVFEDYNISAKDANGEIKTSGAFLLELADKFKTLNTQQQIDIGNKLGLDQGTIALIKLGRDEIQKLVDEGRDLGAFIPKEALANAEEYIDQVNRLRVLFRGLRQRAIAPLLPFLTKLLKQFQDWTIRNRETIKVVGDLIILVLKFATGALVTLIKILKVLLLPLGLLLKALARAIELLGGAERAVKILAVAFGLSLIPKIAAIVPILLSMVKLVKGLAIAFFTLDAAVLLIPALIIAAVAAIILILEDLFTFIEGGESVIGKLVDFAKTALPQIGEYFRELFQSISDWFGELLEPVFEKVQAAGEFFDKLVGKARDFGRETKSAFDEFTDFSGLAGVPAGAPLAARDAALRGASGDFSTQNNTGGVQVDATINVKAGDNPFDTGRSIGRGLQSTYANANKNLATKVER